MKKFKFLTVAAALLAVGTLVTSCWRSDDPSTPAKVTKIEGAKYSVIANSNVNATFSIDVTGVNAQANVKNAAFKDLTAKTVKVTAQYTGADAADYVNATQTSIVEFSEKTTSTALTFTFVKKSTTTKTQAEAEANGATLTNDDNTVATATMTVEKGTTVTNDVTGDFSITVYQEEPAVVDAADLVVNKTLTANVYTINCQPDGAVFSEPVSLTVDYGTLFAGATVKLVNGSEEVTAIVGDDGMATFKVNHFSDWKVVLEPYIEDKVTSTETLATLTINAVAGDNTFIYDRYVGVEHDLKGRSALAANVLLDLFGVQLKTTVNEKASFTANGAGEAKVTVTQKKTVFSLNYENMVRFKGTLWEEVSYKVEMNGEVVAIGHSGGIGQ